MRRKKKFTYALLALMFALMASPVSAQQKQVGKASYYGNRFHGRRTSDGSRYHRDSLTCAHRTLPFGTLLKVRNVKNGKEVVVRVTDRGPFSHGRIVDLSYAAARELGMIAAGVASVETVPVGHMLSTGERFILPDFKLVNPLSGEVHRPKQLALRDSTVNTSHAENSLASLRSSSWSIRQDKVTASAAKTGRPGKE